MDDLDPDPPPTEPPNPVSSIHEIPRSTTSSPKSLKPRPDSASFAPDLHAGGSLAACNAAVVEIQQPAELCPHGQCSAAASTVVESAAGMVGEPVAVLVAADGCCGAGSGKPVSVEAEHRQADLGSSSPPEASPTSIFIGGLVIDFERRIIGVTFFGKDTTHIVPIEIMARCVKHFKKFRTLKQPCVCIRGHAVHSLELSSLEILCLKFPNLSHGIGIVVDQISGISSANFGGIEAGDIICSIDGVVLYSVAQFTAILLDTVFAMKSQKAMILQAVIQRPRDNTKFVAPLNVWENGSVESGNSFCNRWPLL